MHKNKDYLSIILIIFSNLLILFYLISFNKDFSIFFLIYVLQALIVGFLMSVYIIFNKNLKKGYFSYIKNGKKVKPDLSKIKNRIIFALILFGIITIFTIGQLFFYGIVSQVSLLIILFSNINYIIFGILIFLINIGINIVFLRFTSFEDIGNLIWNKIIIFHFFIIILGLIYFIVNNDLIMILIFIIIQTIFDIKKQNI
jgi:hypothetical protein